MSARAKLGAGLALSLLAGLGAGCGHDRAVERPTVPVVPLSLESNLTTATECQYLGQVVGAFALDRAEILEANLVVEFVINTSTSSYNGVRTTGSSLKGTAHKCPRETIDRLLAAAARPPS